MGDLSVLLDWHRRHAPDDFERRRNQLIFEEFQGNRNPFVDFPDLVDAVWTADRYLAPGTWRVTHFTFDELADESVSGWDADPDGDGVINLLEYAFGLDPRDGQSLHPVSVFREGDQNLVSFRKVRDAAEWGMQYHVETSPDLEYWRPQPSETLQKTPHGDFHWEKTLSLETAGFIRIRVTLE
jgi:hypothetical protein